MPALHTANIKFIWLVKIFDSSIVWFIQKRENFLFSCQIDHVYIPALLCVNRNLVEYFSNFNHLQVTSTV